MNAPGNEVGMSRSANWIDADVAEEIGAKPFAAGAVVFPKVGGALLTNKKRRLTRPSVLDNNLMGVTVRDSAVLLPQYLFQWLQSIDLRTLANPGPLPSINARRVYELELPVPPLEVQRRIAKVLSLVQRAIGNEERTIAATRELKCSALARLFAKGLEHGPQRETDIGPVPVSWKVVPLGSLGHIGNGSTPLKSNAAYWSNGSVPWITSAKVYDVTISQAEQFVSPVAVRECHLPMVKAGSVVIAITGQGKTLGHAAVTAIDTTVNQHIAYVQFEQDINPHFVRLFLESRYEQLRAIAHGGGSTKGALTCGFLKTFLVPIAPRGEQDGVVSALMTLESAVSVSERRRTRLDELFASLLDSLMTGEIRVDELDIDASEFEAA